METSFWRKLFVSDFISVIFCAVPRRIWYQYSVMPLYSRCCIIGGSMTGDFSDILLQWSISFIDISSSSILFFISLCSSVIHFELGSGSSVSCETPDFFDFDLRKRKRRARSFGFSVVIRAWSLFYFNLFPDLAESLDLSYIYVSLILVLFLLRE